MPAKDRLTDLNGQRFFGQYVLTSAQIASPPGWAVQEHQQWRLYTLKLPLLHVFNQQNLWLGWCIGHLVADGQLAPARVTLQTASENFDMAAVDDFYQRASGKWALLLVQPGWEKVFLDPYGSLATVFGKAEKTVASTPSLIETNGGWDEELISEVGLPEKDVWLPSGLTSKKGIQRLLPNHSLSLTNWMASRHWPTPETDFSTLATTAAGVATIAENVKGTINAISKAYPLCLTVTAGRDSRAVLASAQAHVTQSSFITFIGEAKSVDKAIAAALCQRFGLNHKFIPYKQASPAELEHWLYLTGWSVSGAIWKIHKSLESVDPNRVLLPGTSAEVHKGVYHRPADRADTKITAQEVLSRCKLPHHPAFIKATEAWLAELHFLDAFKILDLVHLEQRLGCWAASTHYGNTTSAFETAVFNSREIFHTMMRLPQAYRHKKQLAVDICAYTWPELLQFPFNEFTGVKGFFYAKARRIKTLLKEKTTR